MEISEKQVCPAAEPKLVTRPTNELRKHPAYTELRLTVSPDQFCAIKRIGELALKDPLLVTKRGVIIDGYARKEYADSVGILCLPCVELDVDDEEALRVILSKHRRSSGWNDYNRIRMASRLKEVVRARARGNQQAGGQFKGSSNLTEAHVRKEIARAAVVSEGNVTKVQQVQQSDPQLLKALAAGEIRIHRAWLWRALTWPDQREQLRLFRLRRGLNLPIKALASKHRSSTSENDASCCLGSATSSAFLRQLIRTSTSDFGDVGPVSISIINTPGRTMVISADLYRDVMRHPNRS